MNKIHELQKILAVHSASICSIDVYPPINRVLFQLVVNIWLSRQEY